MRTSFLLLAVLLLASASTYGQGFLSNESSEVSDVEVQWATQTAFETGADSQDLDLASQALDAWINNQNAAEGWQLQNIVSGEVDQTTGVLKLNVNFKNAAGDVHNTVIQMDGDFKN